MSEINTVEILDVEFDNVTNEDAVATIFNKYKTKGKAFVVTANPEIVMHAYRDVEYCNIIKQSDMVVADGIGVVIASNILNTPLRERVTGYDLTLKFLEIANTHHLKVYLLGAKENVIENTVKNIKAKYPRVEIVGYHNGYFDINDETIIETVGNTNPDIVLVATGFPRQEKWIMKYHERYNQSIAMGVGGSFDVIAGVSKRAPEWVIKCNLEWAYRLFKEPSRFGRMLDLPRFMLLILKEKLSNKGSRSNESIAR